MAVKALIAPGYRWRLGLIGLVCLLFALWFVHDAAWTYPQQHADYLKWQELGPKNGDDDKVREKKVEAWKVYAKGRVLSYAEPEDRSLGTINGQWVFFALVALVGAYFTILYVLSFRRWVASDDAGLTTNKGQRVPFNSIIKMQKERWKSKGIVIVRYKDPGQRDGRVVLDDWKYDAPATKNILLEVEAHLKPEQIVGGEPERRPDAPLPGDPSTPPAAPGNPA